jgi:ABC-type branched-subunit amino acid transport system substrate-binding protein/predicted Ser/Thr protein kinase
MLCCLNPDCQNPINEDNVSFCANCGAKLIPLLRGRYQPIIPIGGGGFGRTYLAKDIDNLDRACAIKKLAPQVRDISALKKATELFEQEAQRLQQLEEHPQIPSLYAYFEENKDLYLIQQFIEGQNLLEELQQQGKFEETKIRQVLKNILPVLEFVHQNNVIHRDIKPANIIRRKGDNKLVLIDFGTAKQQAILEITQTGTIISSPGYTSLEQMEKGKADRVSDLYSLGVTCFHLLTNIHPKNLWLEFGYSWTSNWQKYLSQPISKQLESILDRLLQKDRQYRYQSATEVLTDLERAYLSRSTTNTKPKLIKSIIWTAISLLFLCAGLGSLHLIMSKSSAIKARISHGDKILISNNINSDKQAGVDFYAERNFKGALGKFQASLQTNSNDPETLIYLNNTKANLTKKFLKIAVSVPIGSNLNVAQEILRGVAQAQDEVNYQGGINGKLLQVEIANDDNQPDLSKKIADAFVRDKEILAAIGHNASDASVAAAPVYDRGKLVMLTPTSFSDNLVNGKDYIFQMTPGVNLLTQKLYDYIRKNNDRPKIGICYDSSAKSSISFTESFKKIAIAQQAEVSDVPCDLARTDFDAKTEIAPMKNQKINALVLVPHVDRINRAIAIAHVDRGKISLFGHWSLYTFETLKFGQESIKGLVMSVPWHPHAVSNNSFSSNAERLWGGAVSWRTAMTYDSLKTIIHGLEQTQNREQLKNLLKSSYFSVIGTTGKIKFQNSGKRDLVPESINLVKIAPGRISATGYDFVLIR